MKRNSSLLSDKFKGYLLGAVAAASYGMNPLFALPLYKDGMNPDSVLLFRYLLAIPIMGVMLAVRRRSFSVERADVVPLMLMGLLMSVSSLALFLSYNYMASGLASTLLFVYPIMVALIMALFFHERISISTLACICLAMLGISMLYKGGDGASLSLVGTLFVFASSLSYAIYIVAVNHSRLKGMPTLKVTFYVLLFGILIFVARILLGSPLTLPSNLLGWVNIFCLALFPTAISFLCTTSAIQYIGSTTTAILGALEPVTAVVIGIIVFGERLTVRELIGLVTIILAVSMVVSGGRTAALLTRFRKLFPRVRLKRGARDGKSSHLH